MYNISKENHLPSFTHVCEPSVLCIHSSKLTSVHEAAHGQLIGMHFALNTVLGKVTFFTLSNFPLCRHDLPVYLALFLLCFFNISLSPIVFNKL